MGAWASRTSNELGELGAAFACKNSNNLPPDIIVFQKLAEQEKSCEAGRESDESAMPECVASRSTSSDPQVQESDLLLAVIALKKIDDARRPSLSTAGNPDKEAKQAVKFKFDEILKRTNTSPPRREKHSRTSVSPSRQSAGVDDGVAIKFEERKKRTSTSPSRLDKQSPSQLGRSLWDAGEHQPVTREKRTSVSPTRQSAVNGRHATKSKYVRPGFGKVTSTSVDSTALIRSLSAWSRK